MLDKAAQIFCPPSPSYTVSNNQSKAQLAVETRKRAMALGVALWKCVAGATRTQLRIVGALQLVYDT